MGTFELNFCGPACRDKSREFWKTVWEKILSTGQTLVVTGPLKNVLKADEATLEKARHSIFQPPGGDLLVAALLDVKLREEFKLRPVQEKKMVWEAARQLRLWRVLLMRVSHAAMFEAKRSC
jgi:hypothetical protein